MFNLEQAILEWRIQMLAAGIQTPTPLDELESHLRDEIEQRMQAGLDEKGAFDASVAKIGHAGVLKTEFAKADGFWSRFGDSRSSRINHILAILWMAQCVWVLAKLIPTFSVGLFIYPPEAYFSVGFFMLMLGIIFYGVGVFGSIHLFRGEKHGRRIIMKLALLGMAAFIAQLLQFRSLSIWGGTLTAFNIISIWLLQERQKPVEVA